MVSKQIDLFEKPVEEEWKREWKDMPEFKQDELTPFKQLIVNFNNEKDFDEFSKLINQKLTLRTKSIYFPEKEKVKLKEYLYIEDET